MKNYLKKIITVTMAYALLLGICQIFEIIYRVLFFIFCSASLLFSDYFVDLTDNHWDLAENVITVVSIVSALIAWYFLDKNDFTIETEIIDREDSKEIKN